MREEEGTLLIYCISYLLYIYYSVVCTDHVWSYLAATHHLSITWAVGHGARVSGRLLRYPVTTVRLSGSPKALPVYRRRGWRLGLSHLLSLVLAGASCPFNTYLILGNSITPLLCKTVILFPGPELGVLPLPWNTMTPLWAIGPGSITIPVRTTVRDRGRVCELEGQCCQYPLQEFTGQHILHPLQHLGYPGCSDCRGLPQPAGSRNSFTDQTRGHFLYLDTFHLELQLRGSIRIFHLCSVAPFSSVVT